MADWLPKPGTITAFEDGSLTLQRAGEDAVYRLTVSGHLCDVSRTDPAEDTIILPRPGSGERPVYASGADLPPFDEQPILASLDEIRHADASGVMSLGGNPFGARAFHYTFRSGRLAALRLVDDEYEDLVPSLTPPEGVQLVWRSDWESWCRWRAGELSGEQFLETARLQASWPFIALVQGLFEADRFVDERKLLPPPDQSLLLLRLVDW